MKRRAKLFSIFSIRTILTNPTYIGQNRWSSRKPDCG
ncbi:recombinase family protein [Brevibacillus antibioticus]